MVGDATPVPVIVKMDRPKPEPKSQNVKVCDVWREEWKNIDDSNIEPVTISDVLERWRK